MTQMCTFLSIYVLLVRNVSEVIQFNLKLGALNFRSEGIPCCLSECAYEQLRQRSWCRTEVRVTCCVCPHRCHDNTSTFCTNKGRVFVLPAFLYYFRPRFSWWLVHFSHRILPGCYVRNKQNREALSSLPGQAAKAQKLRSVYTFLTCEHWLKTFSFWIQRNEMGTNVFHFHLFLW